MAYETISLKRDELYEQVWSRPLRDLARDYGLSDVGLAKICRRLKVPLPGRGYWAQRQAGRTLPRSPLPPLGKDDQTEVRATRVAKEAPSAFLTQALSEVEPLIAREATPENKIKVGSALVKPHPLVARTAQILRSAPDWRVGFSLPPVWGDSLDIRVTPGHTGRALRIMNALIKALEARGYGVSIDAQKKNATTVTLLGQTLEFKLDEVLKRSNHVQTTAEKNHLEKYPLSYAPRYEFRPTGKFALRIRDWSEGKRHNQSDGDERHLEDCLNDFIADLIRVAAIKKARGLEWEERERQWAEDRRRREEQEKLRREEAARLKALEDEALAWHRSNQIRAYVEAVREAATHRGGDMQSDPKLNSWISWALQQADNLDPLKIRQL